MIFYRGPRNETVISFVENDFWLLDEDSLSGRFLSVKKPGCFG
jgi:hypothetical protein